jgi:hypothetical protein
LPRDSGQGVGGDLVRRDGSWCDFRNFHGTLGIPASVQPGDENKRQAPS